MKTRPFPDPATTIRGAPSINFGLEQGIYQTCNCDTSQYNALQSKLQKRVSHGLDFLLTYTWSKAMDNSEGGGGFADNYNVRGSHGPASWDRTNEVTLDHNLDLPFGRDRRWKLGGNRIADAVAGGWRLSGTHNFGSGLPFTPTVSNAPLLNADFNYVFADVVGDPHRLQSQSQSMVQSRRVHASRSSLTGTAPRTAIRLRGPKLVVSNLSISKNLLPLEGKSLEFRAEAFNVFNHVNLGIPNSTVDSLRRRTDHKRPGGDAADAVRASLQVLNETVSRDDEHSNRLLLSAVLAVSVVRVRTAQACSSRRAVQGRHPRRGRSS